MANQQARDGRLRFALVGAGAIAQLRKQALDRSSVAECVGVFDIDQNRADALSGHATSYSDLDALLADPSADAVIVSTPPDTHADIAIAAFSAGKHVLVEKPMAHSLAACRKMVKAARSADKILTVGFNHRYFPAIRDLREAITSGAIGKLSYVRGFTGHTGLSEFKSDWMYSKSVMGGGALMDNGIHLIDLVQHVMGPIERVYGKAMDDIWGLDGVEDNAFALLTGQNGVVGSLNASWSEWKGYHFYLEAYGSKGMARAYYAPMQSSIITMDRPGGKARKKTNYYLPLIIREKLQGWQSTAVQTLTEEIGDFVSLVDGQQPAGQIATGVDGARAIEIANAVYASSKSHDSVELVDGHG